MKGSGKGKRADILWAGGLRCYFGLASVGITKKWSFYEATGVLYDVPAFVNLQSDIPPLAPFRLLHGWVMNLLTNY